MAGTGGCVKISLPCSDVRYSKFSLVCTMPYQVKTPRWLRNIVYSRLIWKMPVAETPAVYITFDDGPHPQATPFALEQLDKYGAKASFFCIGKNVAAHPGI